MFLCTAFPLTLIYVYYKFHLNVNSSFLPDKVPDGRTDGQSGDYMLPPLGSIEMVHSDAIWNDVLEVVTAYKKMKARKLNGTFWHYLKRRCGSCNCLEHVESNEAKWCILALFETVFSKLFQLFEECGRQLTGELLNVEICSSLI